MVIFIATLAIQRIDSVCVEKSTTTIPTTTTTTTTAAPQPIALYHPCTRSMNNWLLQNASLILRCSGGSKNNKCQTNKDCSGSESICCQQNTGCNLCVGNKAKYYMQ